MRATRYGAAFLALLLPLAVVMGCAERERDDVADPGVVEPNVIRGQEGDAPEVDVKVGEPDRDVAIDQADRPEPKVDAPVGATAMAFPTGERESSVLLIDAKMPEKVRAGEEFQYVITLTNVTENFALENVKVHQTLAQGLEIISPGSGSQQQDAQGQQANQQQGNQDQADNQQKQADQEQANQKQGNQAQQNQGQANQGQQNQGQQQDGRHTWSIERLNPGETAAIKVSAVSNQEGKVATCLAVDYQPALCLATVVVKPELSLAKAVPEQASICDRIIWRYTVSNTGTGAIENVVIRDPLPEGLVTMEGGNEIRATVDQLGPGETKQFEISLAANRAGDFSSRATAESAGDLTARSSRPTTRVIQPNLELEVNGPSNQLVGEPVTYEVTVTNSSEIEAEGVLLLAELAENFQVIRSNQPYKEGEANLVFDLGTMPPGDSKTFWIRMRPTAEGTMTHEFVASSECAREKELGAATASIQTEIMAVPALRVLVVDSVDPVTTAEETVYTVRVDNQGSAPDQNVKVVINVPQELKFIEGTGPTDVQSEGQNVVLSIDQLGPGEVAEWHLRMQAQQAGDIRLRAELTSDYLQQPAITMEPTRLFSSEAGVQRERGQQGQQGGGQQGQGAEGQGNQSEPNQNQGGNQG